jgi:hypothetical protein
VRRAATVLVIALVAASCSPPPATRSDRAAPGPPRVRIDVVEQHARQFDAELGARPAGSQQEEAAAAYLFAHLARAGYAARLEAVPVANTVNSTDVIAIPPSGGPADVVVAVPYDTSPHLPPGGTSLGLFLELARALRVREPAHSVGFAALGAERTTVSGGHLGARRLARLLVDAGERPLVLTLELVGELDGFGVLGRAGGLPSAARRLGVPVRTPAPGRALERDVAGRARVFRAARFGHASVGGSAREVGAVLLDYLAADAA